MQASNEISFGRFRLDLTNECLWQRDRAIALRPKAFAVLKLLVDHPGQLVSKEQVLASVWPDTFVGDTVLKDNIRQLRRALEDDAGAPQYIETAHRRGYRFIAKIGEHPSAAAKRPGSGVAVHPAFGARTDLVDAQRVVGRADELARMQECLELSVQGRRQTLFITGEAGIGKTTLVETFLGLAGQLPGTLIVRGQCLEHYGSGEPYLPVFDGFSRLGRSAAGEHVVEILRQVAPAWMAQMPSLHGRLEPNIGPPSPAPASRERMLREMAEALERLSAEHPLLLVLEDLHWSDHSTLDLVSYLARRRDAARLMVIGTYRPVDVILGDHPIKGVKRELQVHGLCTELALEYLDEEVIADYLKLRFAGNHFPSQLRKTIFRRTEGNPLFMVNLLEFFIAQKVLVREAGDWRLGVDVSEVEREVPGNLRDLIEKQIERLSADERLVLEGASVAGVECCSVAIAAGLDMPVEWVDKHCEELARRHQFLSPGWMVELPDGTLTSRHRFNHVLYLEVPYRLIPPIRRAQIHQRCAERGLQVYGDRAKEIASELAMHFEQSHDWRRAHQFLLLAAENANQRSAHHEAADLTTRGLEALRFLPETPERSKQEIRLRMMLGISLMALKGFASTEVEEVYAQGRELFWLQGPSPELFHMLWSLHLYYQFSGKVEWSLELACHILEMAEGLNDGALIMEGHRCVGTSLVVLGRCAEALEHLDKALASYPQHHDHPQKIFVGRDCKVICDSFASRALWSLGERELATQRMDAAAALAREIGHPQTLVVAMYSAGQLHQLNGDAVLSQKCSREAMELADEYGLEFWLPYGVIQLGWAEAELGDSAHGIGEMQRGLLAYESTGAQLWSSYFMGLIADQMNKAGRVKEARATIIQAIERAELSGEKYWLPELQRIQAELLGIS